MVENTRCPVSAAEMAVSNVSRSRISPIRMMSGFWRSTDLIASSKVGTSRPISRCWNTDLSSWNVYSIGSSIVTMCLSMFWLIQLSMAAIVELFPEPVAPQTRRIPSLAFASFRRGSAWRPRSSKFGTLLLMCRKTRLTRPALVERVDAEAPNALRRIGEVDLAQLRPNAS